MKSKMNPRAKCAPNPADLSPQEFPPDPEADALFDGLQALWDEQSVRIDRALAAHPEAHPVGLDYRHSRPYRRRLMATYLVLGLLNVVAGLYAGLSLCGNAYFFVRLIGFALASTHAFLAYLSLRAFRSLSFRHIAGSVRVVSTTPSFRLRSERGFVVTFSRQVVAVSLSALLVFTAFSCAPVGDGHAISKFDSTSRLAIIENIDAIIKQI